MKIESEIALESDWEKLYSKDPESTMSALWTGFRSVKTGGTMEEFANYIQEQYPKIFEAIYQSSLKEFLKGWKNTASARKLHDCVQTIGFNLLNRRDFIQTSVMGILGTTFYSSPMGPSLLEKMLAERMAHIAMHPHIFVVPHREDPATLIWKTILMRRKTPLAKNLSTHFLGYVDAEEQGAVLIEETGDNLFAGLPQKIAQRKLEEAAGVDKNKSARRLGTLFDQFDTEYRTIMRKLPNEVIGQIGEKWHAAASKMDVYPEWKDILKKSLQQAIKYEAQESNEKLKQDLYDTLFVEGHYHDREILKAWREKQDIKNTEEHKKWLKKERKNKMKTVVENWTEITFSVMEDLEKLEDKFFPKRGKIILPAASRY